MEHPTMTTHSRDYMSAISEPTRENLPIRLREGDDLTSRIEAADEIERLRVIEASWYRHKDARAANIRHTNSLDTSG